MPLPTSTMQGRSPSSRRCIYGTNVPGSLPWATAGPGPMPRLLRLGTSWAHELLGPGPPACSPGTIGMAGRSGRFTWITGSGVLIVNDLATSLLPLRQRRCRPCRRRAVNFFSFSKINNLVIRNTYRASAGFPQSRRAFAWGVATFHRGSPRPASRWPGRQGPTAQQRPAAAVRSPVQLTCRRRPSAAQRWGWSWGRV